MDAWVRELYVDAPCLVDGIKVGADYCLCTGSTACAPCTMGSLLLVVEAAPSVCWQLSLRKQQHPPPSCLHSQAVMLQRDVAKWLLRLLSSSCPLQLTTGHCVVENLCFWICSLVIPCSKCVHHKFSNGARTCVWSAVLCPQFNN